MAEKLRNNPVQSRSKDRLQTITAAGVKLYNDPKVGRDRLTTQMVAEKARCSIGTFYRYFPDMYALLDLIAPGRDQSPIIEGQ